jgi:D-alanyl-D-alanine carboxypeptidase
VGLAVATSPLSEAFAKSRKSSRVPTVAASIVVDMKTGHILYSQDPDKPRSPASLTKIMTLYILFGYLKAGKMTLDTELAVTPHAASQAPTKLGLKSGSTIRVSDAIKGMVTKSANDASAVVAENIAGTVEDFARLMTQTARTLGMKNTVFRNASGLPNAEQTTTARDMAILASHVIRDYPEYYGHFETRYFSYKGHRHRNHNRLLYDYQGTDGIKTGYTRASGFNLTASVKRGEKHLVAVVLGGRTGYQRDTATRALLDKYWSEASTGKARPLVATAQPPLPEPKKPVFAMAAAAPKLAAAEEGDRSDPADISETRPSLLGSPGPVNPSVAGDYHVQVGAFTSLPEAENRLGKVQQRAAKLLEGHLPFTATFTKNDTEWYRARFAGFSQDKARSTCDALKNISLDCVVMAAE